MLLIEHTLIENNAKKSLENVIENNSNILS